MERKRSELCSDDRAIVSFAMNQLTGEIIWIQQKKLMAETVVS
jgi:hypothetical protein